MPLPEKDIATRPSARCDRDQTVGAVWVTPVLGGNAISALDGAAASRFHEQMQNQLIDGDEGRLVFSRPGATLTLTRGVTRLFRELGLAPLAEFKLPNGRRADLAGIDLKGRLVIAEIKSCEADYATDCKWADYLPFCDFFFFAVGGDFPKAILPEGEGLIVADGYGGAVLRDAVARPLASARRKAVTLRFARQAAARSAFALEDFLK